VGTTRFLPNGMPRRRLCWGPGTRSAPTISFNGAGFCCVPGVLCARSPVARYRIPCRAREFGEGEGPQAVRGVCSLRAWLVVGAAVASRRWARRGSSRTVCREGVCVGARGLVPHRPPRTTARGSVVFQGNLCGRSPSRTRKTLRGKKNWVVGAAGELRADRAPSRRLSGRVTPRGRAGEADAIGRLSASGSTRYQPNGLPRRR